MSGSSPGITAAITAALEEEEEEENDDLVTFFWRWDWKHTAPT